jgi:hypothetical protein
MLVQTLRQADADRSGNLDQRDINPYLMEHVIFPYLCGDTVRLSTLDYSMFTTDDIVIAHREINAVAHHANNTNKFAKGFRKVTPTTGKLKVFC